MEEGGNASVPRVVPDHDAHLRRQVLRRPLGDSRRAVSAQEKLQSPFDLVLQASRQEILIAGGSASRTSFYRFPYPYAFAASGTVPDQNGILALEDQWIVEAHVINTQNMSSRKQALCAECPCTLEDRKANAMINGEAVLEGMCNLQLQQENNTACAFATYLGGLHCCVEGEFCLEREALTIQPERIEHKASGTSLSTTDVEEGTTIAAAAPVAPISSFYLKYTIEYSPAVDANRWLYVATCCDATGDLTKPGNLEYDVPACSAKHDGIAENAASNESKQSCIHTLTTHQLLDSGTLGNPVWDQKRTTIAPKQPNGASATISPTQSKADPDREVDLVYAVGHQHRRGLGIHIYLNSTGELLCASLPRYSSSDDSSRVGMKPCVFDPPRRLRASDVVRIDAMYDSSEAHIGAQSLMYLAIHDVSIEREQLLLDQEGLVAGDEESILRDAAADVVGDLNDLVVLVGLVASAMAAFGLFTTALKRRRVNAHAIQERTGLAAKASAAGNARAGHGRYDLAAASRTTLDVHHPQSPTAALPPPTVSKQ